MSKKDETIFELTAKLAQAEALMRDAQLALNMSYLYIYEHLDQTSSTSWSSEVLAGNNDSMMNMESFCVSIADLIE